MVLAAIPVGLLIGLALGALGGGGSILTVPALVFLIGMDPRAAATGSLIIVGITALIAVVAHARDGRVRVGHGIVFGLVGVAGAVAGTRLSVAVRGDVLLAVFSVLLLVVAALMLTRTRVLAGAGTGDGGPVDGRGPLISLDPPMSCACARLVRIVAAATAVGLTTGFFGVGGGFLIVPALVLVLDFPMATAVGTSLLVIAVNSATSLAARAGSGIEIDWPVIGVFTAVAVVGSLLGARITTRVDPDTLRIAFGLLVGAVAIYTASVSALALLS